MKSIFFGMLIVAALGTISSYPAKADRGETMTQWYKNRIRDMQAAVDIFNTQIHQTCGINSNQMNADCVAEEYTSAANLLKRASWKYESLSLTITNLEAKSRELHQWGAYDRSRILALNSGYVNEILGYLYTAQDDLAKCQPENK